MTVKNNKTMEVKDIQNEYRIITGEDIVNSQGEPDIDYVLWLEMELIDARRLLKESDSLPCVRGCFSPDEVIEILNDATDLEDAKIMVNEGFANEG